MKKLSGFIFHKLLGWKISGAFEPSIKKSVIIVVPHTSWHDFYIGILARKVLQISINYIAKKELFDSPIGWYFKWTGGAPIDRSKNLNTVEQITSIFASKKEFHLALAPEGTRKKTETWKSGFYYIALAAKVPIFRVAFDYKTKTVKIAKPFYPTGDYEKDLVELRSFFKGAVGKIPQYTAEI
ncbi:MAG TPA: 1-acyl-sn-glycerol-3-phosphate acyltransferase [Flavobacteriaceae bacterium]|nr:1-acyl-sn-glycerol-3-phosphate acyltransferase [Flavobacteriaceae bacterium]